MVRISPYAMLLTMALAGMLTVALAGTLSAPPQQRRGSSSGAPSAELTVQRKSTASRSECPDPQAEKACKSYQELREAGDQSVRVLRGEIAFACFRRPEDVFFVWHVTPPPVVSRTRGDDQLQESVSENVAYPSTGSLNGFIDGIERTASVPIHFFEGEWKMGVGGYWFSATRLDGKTVANTESFGLWIDPLQITASVRYKNEIAMNIDYRLVIQRSTGRFSEKYTDQSAKLPISEMVGRCSKVPAS